MTFNIGDHVERNPATVPVHQVADWRREFPGGRRGVVLGIDEDFSAQPYHVRWADGAEAYYAGRDLLEVVESGQPSLFGEAQP